MDQQKSSLNFRSINHIVGGIALDATVDSLSAIGFALGGSNPQAGTRPATRGFFNEQIRVRNLSLWLDSATTSDTVSAITLATTVAGATAVNWTSTSGATSITNLVVLNFRLVTSGTTTDLIVPAGSSLAVVLTATTSTVTAAANIGCTISYYLDS